MGAALLTATMSRLGFDQEQTAASFLCRRTTHERITRAGTTCTNNLKKMPHRCGAESLPFLSGMGTNDWFLSPERVLYGHKTNQFPHTDSPR